MISMGEEYRTRDGRAVKVLCVDMKSSEYPVVAIVCEEDGSENQYSFSSEGVDYIYDNSTTERDLIEVLPSVVFWVNVRHETQIAVRLIDVYDTKAESLEDAGSYDIIARRVELDVLGEEE